MSILYVGRPANFHGRPLWEILLNLKNFGVGRIVTRSTFNFKYPETTFYRIVQVEPTLIDYKDKMVGKILVDPSFKHKTQEMEDIGRYGYKPDFFLIPRHEEESFFSRIQIIEKPPVIHPGQFQFPPLWQELIKRDKASEGVQAKPEDFVCKALYEDPKVIVADEGQKPTFLFSDFKPVTPSLYEDLKMKQ